MRVRKTAVSLGLAGCALVIIGMLSAWSTSLGAIYDATATPGAILQGGPPPDPLPTRQAVETPRRDTLVPLTADNVGQLALLAAWDLPPTSLLDRPQWGAITFDPRSALLARVETGYTFFEAGGWHVWDVSDPTIPADQDIVSGTTYDYTAWDFATTVFTTTGYAQARVMSEFSGAPDWGGSAVPDTRQIVFRRSGGPDTVVKRPYHGQDYAPQISLHLSQGGTRLTFFEEGTLYLWDSTQERLLASTPIAGFSDVAGFSPDNQIVVTVEGDELVFRWAEQDNLVRILSIPTESAFAFMPNSLQFFATADHTLTRWDLTTQAAAGTADLPCRVNQMAVSPDGALLALSADCYGVEGRSVSEIQFWQTSTLREAASIPVDGTVTDLAFSPDGTLFATGSARRTRLWGVMAEL
jgi:WD40 repeat protein